MNTENLLIKERDIELAQNECRAIKNPDLRNRAVSNVLAAKIAEKVLNDTQNDLDIESGLHNISNALEDIDISDIYINGSYVDVRLYFDDSELSVPKAHFDNGLLPAAYMFVKMSSDLAEASVTGFILPSEVNTTSDVNGFYRINENELVSFYDIETNIIRVDDSYSVEDEQIFAYLDNKLENKKEFYKELLASKDGRLRLANAAKAQYLFNFVSVVETDNETANDISDETMFDGLNDLSEELPLEEDILMAEDDSSLSFDLEESDSAESPLDELEEVEESIGLEAGFGDDLFEKEPLEEIVQEESSELEESALDTLFEASTEEESFGLEAELNELEEFGLEEQAPEIKEEENNFRIEAEENTISALFEEEKEEEDNKTSFEFSTTVSPSLESVDNMYEELLENDNSGEDKEVEEASLTEEELTEEALEEEAEEVQEEKAPEDTTEQIDALFDNDESEAAEENLEEEPAPQVKRNSAKPLLVLGLLVVLGAAGYFGYTKFNTPASLEDELQTPVAAEPEQPKEVVQSEAMPIETVDVQAPKAPSNEGNAVSIPAIEQNLDASILVSNLHVFWEVPSGYASNTSASRYLQKLGKIIQLNLKTELLLLNKPPITNKIGVEIKFNKSTRKFETVGITASSGEKSVDNLILQTVSRVLSMNLNINTDSLSKLQGNPVLIIRL